MYVRVELPLRRRGEYDTAHARQQPPGLVSWPRGARGRYAADAARKRAHVPGVVAEWTDGAGRRPRRRQACPGALERSGLAVRAAGRGLLAPRPHLHRVWLPPTVRR